MDNIFTGALLDTRNKEEKEKDYFFKETVATTNTVNWVEKPENEWRTFPVQNQDGSGSCVAQTARKLLRVIFSNLAGKDLDFSASHIYQRRQNKPQGGMIGVDAMNILIKGTTLNSLMPSDNLTDAQMDLIPETSFDKKVGEVFSVSNYVQFDNGDFETIASTIQTTGKGVMVWFYFTSSEWSRLTPIIENPSLNINNASRHSVCAIDFFLKNGKKYLLVEDSAHFGGFTRHLISEEFFKVRNFFSAYPINFKYATSEIPVIDEITKTLRFGMKDDQVVILQKLLQNKGYFPINIQLTGYFGSITLRAVKNFQKDFNLKVDGIVGKLTISKLL